jgi:hypothetical protein
MVSIIFSNSGTANLTLWVGGNLPKLDIQPCDDDSEAVYRTELSRAHALGLVDLDLFE